MKNISPKLIARLALFAAISLILGKFLSFKMGDWGRVSLENLTVILAGYLYGSFPGMLCGVVADIVGCMLYGYPINPIITVGAAMVGAYAGIFGMHGNFKVPRLYLSVAAAHIAGSLIVKSIGIHVFYSTPLDILILRLPIYIVTGVIEYIIISIMLKNRALKELMQ